MAAIAITNANIFVFGYNLSGQYNQIALDFAAESLEATAFGADTRIKRGGLKTAKLTGAGFWQAGVGNVHQVSFDNVGVGETAAIVFPDAIGEGATSTGSGYMFKLTTARYQLGAKVGDILPFTLDLEGRGVQSAGTP